MKKYIWMLIAILVIATAAFLFLNRNGRRAETENRAANDPIAIATYSCNKGHSIKAAFFTGAAVKPEPGQPPVPTGKVLISLDGGQTTTLLQTISGDGVRFSDGDPQVQQGKPGAETLVFWNKGDSALIMRNNAMDLTFTDCTSESSNK